MASGTETSISWAIAFSAKCVYASVNNKSTAWIADYCNPTVTGAKIKLGGANSSSDNVLIFAVGW